MYLPTYLPALLAGIATIVASVMCDFGGGGGIGGSIPKGKGTLKKWLDSLHSKDLQGGC